MTPRTLLGALSVVAILFATALAAVSIARRDEARALDHDRSALTQLVGGITAETGRLMAVADSAGALVAEATPDDGQRFRALGRRIVTQPGVGYLDWLPRVTQWQRPAYERIVGRSIWTGDATRHTTVAVARRREYFPVLWEAAPDMVPQVGFDPSAFPLTAPTVGRAIATGLPVTTQPLPSSFTDPTPQTLLFVPVHRDEGRRDELVGLIGASVTVGQLASVQALPAGTVQVRDGDGLLAGPDRIHGPVLTDTVQVAGRVWTVTLARTPSGDASPWLVMAAGLALATTVGSLFVVARRAERRALALVETRLAERRAVEDQLRAERDRSGAMLDALQDGLLVLDADGTVVRANGQMSALTGFEPEALVGCRAPMPFWPQDDDTAERAFTTMADAGHLEVEVSLRRRDGRQVWVIMTAAPLLDAARRVTGHLVTLKDITRRRDAEEELAAMASSDALTGLANHRSFHDLLTYRTSEAEVGRVPLTVAVLDLDHFKQINDSFGHQAGDEALREVARRLGACARGGDTVARVGGEEFAWLLPGATAEEAMVAVERARRAVAEVPLEGIGTVTISAGVCDLEGAGSASDLYRLADGALYWAKANGRNRTIQYTPELVVATSAEEHASRMERLRAITTVQALARAVDARDESTRRHSERVALLAGAVARELGWSDEDADQLRGAGLVHDVGKIGVPEAILFKQGGLTADEHEQVKSHASLGAQIVAGALSERQARWVRGHHERWDGRGYPDGLAGEDIPEGARVLALADAWDVMTVARSYTAPRDVDDAVRECRAQAGHQFWPDAVEALVRLVDTERLPVMPSQEAPTGGP